MNIQMGVSLARRRHGPHVASAHSNGKAGVAATMRVALLLSLFLLALVPAAARAQDSGAFADISVSVIQQAAPDGATRSITFLSSGYISEDAFLRDATACRNALLNNSAGIIADPWPRYMPFMNVYAVYQPSPEAGASRPQGPLHDCAWMRTCSAPAVRNNLDCQFGTPNPHLMNCDINKVVTLATASPAQDLVVVLINANDPGGVATNGIAYITNDDQFMAYMLVHYLNRATANLHEEYSLGLEASQADATLYVAPNCAISRANAMEKWRYWFPVEVEAQTHYMRSLQTLATTNDTALYATHDHTAHSFVFPTPVTAAPVWDSSVSLSDISLLPPNLQEADLGSGCSFGNFIAPTTDSCLMRNSSLNFMCPVCREQLSRAFYFAGVDGSVMPNPSRAHLNLVAQRCPPEGLVLYVDPQATTALLDATALPTTVPPVSAFPRYRITAPALYLTLGDAVDQSDMEILWTLEETGAALAVNTSTLVLHSADVEAWSFPAMVRATVVDHSPYVRPELRDGAFTATTTFTVQRRDATSSCLTGAAAPSCVVDLANGEAGVELCVGPDEATGAAARETEAASPNVTAVDVLGESPGKVYDETNIIIVACVTGGVALIFIFTVFSVYSCYVRVRPREVLNAQLQDRIILYILMPCCVVDLVVAVLVLIFAMAFIPEDFVVGLQMMIAAVVFGGVVYLVTVANTCGVLFRWYAVCLACCVLFFIVSLGFFALGIVALWAHFNQQSPGLSSRLASLWQETLAKDATGNAYICTLQYHLQCSGFHTGCFMTNSSQCPRDCGSNYYVNACQVPFLAFIGERYLPVGILLVVGGFMCVITASLDTLYFMRFRQLSRTGRLRRVYRKDPHAPVVPITHHECRRARHFFHHLSHDPEPKVAGKQAVQFLETVFGNKLDKHEREYIEGLDSLSFDELMSLYFPYVVAAAADPRMLSPDEADEATGMMDLQRKQYAKLRAFANAAGPLSPEKLHEIYQDYAQSRFMPEPNELLDAIAREASRSPDAPFCRGLASMELEGLRAAWVTLHPSVRGGLSQEEIRLFYEWCHGQPLPVGDKAAFKAWCSKLDVRKTGVVGWAEFCYPYAQRALLREARKVLAPEKEIPPEVLSRKAAMSKYGAAVVEECFLPNEEEIPVERLLASLVQKKEKST